MPKARHRKDSSFKTSVTKSIFLYGNPNQAKSALLHEMQDRFLSLVNNYIKKIDSCRGIASFLIKNDKKSPEIRALEKGIRPAGVNSAFCQNAFDMAFTCLANRMDSIRLEIYSHSPSIFSQSKVLFGMSLDGRTKEDMVSCMAALSKKDGDFYGSCAAGIAAMDTPAFRSAMSELHDSCAVASLEYKVPQLKSVEVPLDSRLMTVTRSENIQAPYVIRISDPFHRNHCFDVPLYSSGHSLHKASTYKMAGTVRIRMEGRQLKVSWAYGKHLKKPKTSVVNGVDTGIADALHVSDGSTYGSMSGVIGYYKEQVEPAFAGLSHLRDKKSHISHYMRTHPSIPEDVRRSLIRKMDRLDHMIQTMGAPYRKKRRYYGMLDEAVSKTVKRYIRNLPPDTLTVLEALDIKEFRKSRKVNGMFSLFARGTLQERLMEELNWHGYDFMEVDPAYTSQVCPVCENLDSNNRIGKEFHCTCCGHGDDADHNAAVNIAARADDQEILSLCESYRYDKKTRHLKLKELYKERNYCFMEKHSTRLKTICAAHGCSVQEIPSCTQAV